MARQLRTPALLAQEAARLLNEAAEREARRLTEADARAPHERDLFSTLVRCHYEPLWEAKKQAAKAQTRAALEAEIRQEQKLQQQQAREARKKG
jgi:hypothetical protein